MHEPKRTRASGNAIDRNVFVKVGPVATAVTSSALHEGLASLTTAVERTRGVGLATIRQRLAALGAKPAVILGDQYREETWDTP